MELSKVEKIPPRTTNLNEEHQRLIQRIVADKEGITSLTATSDDDHRVMKSIVYQVRKNGFNSVKRGMKYYFYKT